MAKELERRRFRHRIVKKDYKRKKQEEKDKDDPYNLFDCEY